ncbi:MAG: Hsp70 family protein, partial [Planctomycetaceae bacterium]|nr:Hsp70 family protein [Planctomycetaceae bacterium]
MAFGIDLGTTYSAVAMMKDGRPELIPNSLGEVLTPSVVAFDERGVPMVGKPAREYAVLHPARAAAVFKRHMGSEWTVKLGGRERSATELSAILLSHLRQEAEQRIGKSIEKVVITVPAYFNDAQRNATIEAGEAAGMEVQRVINEPTAAAIAYGLHEIDQERTAAIIDLGGGTFDVSIIEQYESVVEVKSSAGEIFLGGEDFTSALVFQLLQQQGHTLEIAEMRLPQQVARVRHICERLKRELTDQEQVTFRWPDEQGQADPDGKEVIVTRTQFNEWTEHILTRLTRPLRRAIGDAGVTPDEIDNVILVGGATRMPCVIQLTEKLFNQKAKYNLPPDSVVALGAAIQAGLIEKDGGLGELVVTDVAPFTLGIEISRKIGNQYRDGYFDPIIPRNTPLPTSRMSRVSTLAPNQTHIRVAIYQGESRRVEENLLLGELNIDGIPPGPPGQEVDVRFSYDLN